MFHANLPSICVGSCASSKKRNVRCFSSDSFSCFVSLRELNLSLNGLCNMTFEAADFPHLQVRWHLICTFPFPFSILCLFCLFDAVILIWNDWIWSSQVLDLSYNSLSAEGILSISRLPHLKVLHLTGNQLRRLPPKLGSSNHDATQLLVPYCPWSSNIKVTQYSCLYVNWCRDPQRYSLFCSSKNDKKTST